MCAQRYANVCSPERHVQECSLQLCDNTPHWKQPICSLTRINIWKNTHIVEYHANYCYTCKTWKSLTNIMLGQIRHKRAHIVWFYLYNVQHQAKQNYAARGRRGITPEGVAIRGGHMGRFWGWLHSCAQLVKIQWMVCTSMICALFCMLFLNERLLKIKTNTKYISRTWIISF